MVMGQIQNQWKTFNKNQTEINLNAIILPYGSTMQCACLRGCRAL